MHKQINKVKDLIAELSKFDPELPVVFYSEDELLLEKVEPGYAFRVAMVDHVSAVDAEMTRTPNHAMYLGFNKSSNTTKMVLIDVSAE